MFFISSVKLHLLSIFNTYTHYSKSCYFCIRSFLRLANLMLCWLNCLSKEKFWLKPSKLHIFNERILSEYTMFRHLFLESFSSAVGNVYWYIDSLRAFYNYHWWDINQVGQYAELTIQNFQKSNHLKFTKRKVLSSNQVLCFRIQKDLSRKGWNLKIFIFIL